MQHKRGGRSAKKRMADLAGGPGTIRGIEYQISVSTMQMLKLLSDAARDPTDPLLISPEKRLVASDGQFGYDLGWSGGRHARNEVWEAKVAPTVQDVTDFLVGARERLEGNFELDPAPRLVAAESTAAFKALDRLVRLAREAEDEAAFLGLLGAIGDPGLDKYLEVMGDSAWNLLRCILDPEFVAEVQVDTVIVTIVTMTAMPGRVSELRSTVAEWLRSCAQRRRSFSAGSFAVDLQDRGLLAPPPVIDHTQAGEPTLLAIAMLQHCPLPATASALSAVLQVDHGQLEEVLADALTTGIIARLNTGWTTYTTAHAPLVVPNLDGLLAAALRSIVEEAGTVGPALAAQSPNALALARAVDDRQPELVAEVFAAFDKASKAWGNLSLVQSLAELSSDAASRVAAKVSSSPQVVAHMAAARARCYICGVGWVLQRVDELDEAAQYMKWADELSEAGDNPTNRAFTLKCRGRLARLQAERLDVASQSRSALLGESERQLGVAYDLFGSLVAGGELGCVEDHGECLSLLARTQATAGKWEEAQTTARDAHAILDGCPETKAYADLVVLDAELAVHAYRSGQTELGVLDGHLAALQSLRQQHRRAGDATDERATSEIAARILVAQATMEHLRGNDELAAELLEEAAALYESLTYPMAQCRVLWERAAMQPERVPAPLLELLDAERADSITRVFALEIFETRRGDRAGGTLARDDSFWQGVVAAAKEKASVSRPRWGEGRRPA